MTPRAERGEPRPRQVSHINRARHIAATLGIYCAARYLRKRGWSVEAAQWILTAH